jgi:hypothetical protein
MRLKAPRIAPVTKDDWSPAQREALAPYAARDQLYNIYTTLGRVPEALTAFVTWGAFVSIQTSSRRAKLVRHLRRPLAARP